MTTMEKSFTRSIDTFTIEIANYAGRDYVEISRANLKGNPASLIFPVGDEPAACGFLSQVAELLGVKIVTPGK
jgi:hypothetical protein